MNGFFNFRKLVVGVMAATCFMGFQSCLDDDDDYPYSKVLPNALVTVKPVDDGSYFLQSLLVTPKSGAIGFVRILSIQLIFTALL